MGDRRIADRRAPEEGVFRIEKKKMWVYLVIILAFAIFVVSTIVLGILYTNSKNEYEAIVDGLNDSNLVENEITISNSSEQYTCDLTITGDKSHIKAGETITYELKAENINAGTGIAMFETLLDYDAKLFECDIITDENSAWTKTSLLEDSLTMSRKDLLPSTENQTIAKLAVKAKEDIKEGSYTINLLDLKFVMENDKSFSVSDRIIDVNVLNN